MKSSFVFLVLGALVGTVSAATKVTADDTCWFMNGPGEDGHKVTCNDVCSAMASSRCQPRCNAEGTARVNSRERMQFVMQLDGVECDSMIRGSTDVPLIDLNGLPNIACGYGKRGDCETSVPYGRMRLCCCGTEEQCPVDAVSTARLAKKIKPSPKPTPAPRKTRAPVKHTTATTTTEGTTRAAVTTADVVAMQVKPHISDSQGATVQSRFECEPGAFIHHGSRECELVGAGGHAMYLPVHGDTREALRRCLRIPECKLVEVQKASPFAVWYNHSRCLLSSASFTSLAADMFERCDDKLHMHDIACRGFHFEQMNVPTLTLGESIDIPCDDGFSGMRTLTCGKRTSRFPLFRRTYDECARTDFDKIMNTARTWMTSNLPLSAVSELAIVTEGVVPRRHLHEVMNIVESAVRNRYGDLEQTSVQHVMVVMDALARSMSEMNMKETDHYHRLRAVIDSVCEVLATPSSSRALGAHIHHESEHMFGGHVALDKDGRAKLHSQKFGTSYEMVLEKAKAKSQTGVVMHAASFVPKGMLRMSDTVVSLRRTETTNHVSGHERAVVASKISSQILEQVSRLAEETYDNCNATHAEFTGANNDKVVVTCTYPGGSYYATKKLECHDAVIEPSTGKILLTGDKGRIGPNGCQAGITGFSDHIFVDPAGMICLNAVTTPILTPRRQIFNFSVQAIMYGELMAIGVTSVAVLDAVSHEAIAFELDGGPVNGTLYNYIGDSDDDIRYATAGAFGLGGDVLGHFIAFASNILGTTNHLRVSTETFNEENDNTAATYIKCTKFSIAGAAEDGLFCTKNGNNNAYVWQSAAKSGTDITILNNGNAAHIPLATISGEMVVGSGETVFLVFYDTGSALDSQAGKITYSAGPPDGITFVGGIDYFEMNSGGAESGILSNWGTGESFGGATFFHFSEEARLSVAMAFDAVVQAFYCDEGASNAWTAGTAIATPGGSPEGLVSADLNGDGSGDLVWREGADIKYALSTSRIEFAGGSVTVQSSGMESGFTLLSSIAGDINGDGDDDVAFAGTANGTDGFAIYIMNGLCSNNTGCAAGTYYTQSADNCTACPVGTHLPVAVSNISASVENCTACPVGYHQNKTGQSLCVICPAGFYQDTAGQSECIGCDPGYYQGSAGTTECTACSAGTYSIGNATACTPCAAGSYQGSAGSSSCDLCANATFSGKGMEECEDCRVGYFAAEMGMSACLKCAIHKFTNVTRDRCFDCPEGYVGAGEHCVLLTESNDLITTLDEACPEGYKYTGAQYTTCNVNSTVCKDETTGTALTIESIFDGLNGTSRICKETDTENLGICIGHVCRTGFDGMVHYAAILEDANQKHSMSADIYCMNITDTEDLCTMRLLGDKDKITVSEIKIHSVTTTTDTFVTTACHEVAEVLECYVSGMKVSFSTPLEKLITVNVTDVSTAAHHQLKGTPVRDVDFAAVRTTSFQTESISCHYSNTSLNCEFHSDRDDCGTRVQICAADVDLTTHAEFDTIKTKIVNEQPTGLCARCVSMEVQKNLPMKKAFNVFWPSCLRGVAQYGSIFMKRANGITITAKKLEFTVVDAPTHGKHGTDQKGGDAVEARIVNGTMLGVDDYPDAYLDYAGCIQNVIATPGGRLDSETVDMYVLFYPGRAWIDIVQGTPQTATGYTRVKAVRTPFGQIVSFRQRVDPTVDIIVVGMSSVDGEVFIVDGIYRPEVGELLFTDKDGQQLYLSSPYGVGRASYNWCECPKCVHFMLTIFCGVGLIFILLVVAFKTRDEEGVVVESKEVPEVEEVKAKPVVQKVQPKRGERSAYAVLTGAKAAME